MHSDDDPYRHHPELRGRIGDPEASFFRSFRPSDFDAQMRAIGHGDDWRHPDDLREARRQAFLGNRLTDDVWVFAYGSLMWDPAFHHAEVRVGRIEGYARRFCLKDTFGARGTPDTPGLMAALDRGPSCTGLVFRIPAALADRETEVVWRREAINDTYRPVFLPVATAQGAVEALTFVANHAARDIAPGLTRAEQVRYLATGTGTIGTSRAYLENIAAQFAALGIEDAEVAGLLAEVRAWADADPR